MNDTLTLYHALHDTGRPRPLPSVHDVAIAMRAVMERAHDTGSLEMGGPWQLHQREGRALEATTGFTPQGGWSALVGLMADGSALSVDEDHFVPTCSLADFCARPSQVHRRHLIEALSMNLVPPKTAAGLFLLMGLHPAWGLRVASSIHGEEHHAGSGLGDRSLFPEDALVAVREGIFCALSALLETLASLHVGMAYDLDALGPLVARVATFGHDVVASALPEPSAEAIGVFVPALHKHLPSIRERALDFTLVDLMDGFLLPAHIIRRHDDRTFCVLPDALDADTRVQGLEALGAARCLPRMLTGDDHTHVA